jgi:DNA-binding NarL/FixJ family response regulator
MKRKSTVPALRVLLTDDHAITRLGIRQLLQESFPHASFGEAADAAATLQQVTAQRWHLLILDISLPDRDGLDVLREVKQCQPRLPVLMFSVHPEDQFALRALKLGAAGYLAKERAPEELAQAVRTVLAGGTYLPPALTARLNVQPGAPVLLPHERLSAREFEVLRLIAVGRTGKEIAAQLGVNQKTISTYRSRLLAKLKLTSTAALVRYATENHLLA